MRKAFVKCFSTVASRSLLVSSVLISTLVVARVEIAEQRGSTALSQNLSTKWLYVLDTKKRAEEGEILVVNADTGQVAKTIPTGLSADFNLSPGGNRAYVVSRPKGGMDYVLQLLTVPDGSVLSTQTVIDRADHASVVPPHTMAVSPNGLLVYLITLHWTPEQAGVPQRDEYKVAVYDGLEGRFLTTVSLPAGCYGNYLLPSQNALYVLCSLGNDVSIFSASSDGLSSQRRTVQLPPPPKHVVTSIVPTSDTATSIHPALMGAVISPDSRMLTVVTSYMRLLQIDTSTTKIVAQKQVRDDRWAMPETVVGSPDGNRLYIGVGPISRLNRASGIDEILVLDAHTLSTLGTINTSAFFDTLSMSRDGHWLYATSYDTASIHLIDTYQGRESRVLSGIGVSPARCWD